MTLVPIPPMGNEYHDPPMYLYHLVHAGTASGSVTVKVTVPPEGIQQMVKLNIPCGNVTPAGGVTAVRPRTLPWSVVKVALPVPVAVEYSSGSRGQNQHNR